MDLFANQEKAIENYFDGLLLADDGSMFEDADDVSPLLADKPESISARRSSQPTPKQSVAVQNFLNRSTKKSATSSPSVNLASVQQTIASIDFQQLAHEADVSTLELDKFLFIKPISVVGLKLALPMDHISEVLTIDEANVQQCTEHSMVSGVMEYQGRETVVLDAATIIVPENHPRRATMLARKRYQHIVVFKHGNVAMAVDAVDEEVYLPTERVRWSTNSNQYGWLAGTITDYGYALINTAKFVKYLSN